MSLYAIPSVDEINEQSDKPELTSQEDLGVQVASVLLEEVAHGGVVDSTHQRAPTAPLCPCPDDNYVIPHIGPLGMCHVCDFSL